MGCFNPRICKRCDNGKRIPFYSKCRFNPRICKRCDLVTDMVKLWIKSFNPRICKRCDLGVFSRCLQETVSIHASVKDATFSDKVFFFLSKVSIHASVKDATYIRERCQCWIMVSIHASVKDATMRLRLLMMLVMFQSTHL